MDCGGKADGRSDAEYSTRETNLCSALPNCTYVNDPVLGAVGVGAAHVEAAVGHGLNHADVVPAVELLEQSRVKANECLRLAAAWRLPWAQAEPQRHTVELSYLRLALGHALRHVARLQAQRVALQQQEEDECQAGGLAARCAGCAGCAGWGHGHAGPSPLFRIGAKNYNLVIRERLDSLGSGTWAATPRVFTDMQHCIRVLALTGPNDPTAVSPGVAAGRTQRRCAVQILTSQLDWEMLARFNRKTRSLEPRGERC